MVLTRADHTNRNLTTVSYEDLLHDITLTFGQE